MKLQQIKPFAFIVLLVVVLLFIGNASAQLRFPRPSQRASLTQTIGLTELSIVYHRPQVKGRTIFGCTTTDLIPVGGKTYDCLVPYNQVWRVGANEATTFEVSEEVMINGQKLPKGKYSIHAIPTETEWTIIFSKNWGQWGSFSYKESEDALRVKVKPQTSHLHETLIYHIEDLSANKATVDLLWDKVKVSFTVEVPDPIRQAQNESVSVNLQTANYILQNKLKDRYADAINMVNAALSIRETYNALNIKARLTAEMGNFKDAVAVGEKAVQVGKSSNANTAGLERLVSEWKQKSQ